MQQVARMFLKHLGSGRCSFSLEETARKALHVDLQQPHQVLLSSSVILLVKKHWIAQPNVFCSTSKLYSSLLVTCFTRLNTRLQTRFQLVKWRWSPEHDRVLNLFGNYRCSWKKDKLPLYTEPCFFVFLFCAQRKIICPLLFFNFNDNSTFMALWGSCLILNSSI